ncbi:MAG: peptide deformylase [Candidatus Omnitrophica bacterium]|nr:peptide deformylase [Candidatus Omnitrophota bacterium]
MAVLPVLKFPHKALQTKAAQVPQVTDVERRFVKDMIDTMYAEGGVGLAANQVGVLKQIFVASPDQARGKEFVYFNPRIVRKEGEVKEFEGCLSVPELYEPVKRAKKVWIKAMTLSGEWMETAADGLLARIFQHEIDHLNGFLFIDRLGLLKSKSVRRRLSRRHAASSKK